MKNEINESRKNVIFIGDWFINQKSIKFNELFKKLKKY